MQKYYPFLSAPPNCLMLELGTQTIDKVHPLGKKLSSGRVCWKRAKRGGRRKEVGRSLRKMMKIP